MLKTNYLKINTMRPLTILLDPTFICLDNLRQRLDSDFIRIRAYSTPYQTSLKILWGIYWAIYRLNLKLKISLGTKTYKPEFRKNDFLNIFQITFRQRQLNFLLYRPNRP